MLLPRSTALRGSIRSFSFKRAGTQVGTSLRGVGRRTYASEHGAQKSSDLPWLIGSVVVTVPAAGWLLQQAPSKSHHGHAHEVHSEEEHGEEAPAEEEPKQDEEPAPQDEDSGEEDEKQEEGKDEGKEEDKDDGGKAEGKDEGKDDFDDHGNTGKDKEVSRKGKAVGESKGEKDAQGNISGANNPFMGSPERQHKPEGPAATAKFHGTVDKSQRPSEEPPRPDETDQPKQKENEPKPSGADENTSATS